jgi:membrane-associated protease RseP (regulator of RpoE activity)
MENVRIYNGTGDTIELALGKVLPRQVITIQKDQVTSQVLQRYGESIAIADMDNLVVHVGTNVNPQYLIRQFGWQVSGIAPYKAPSRANKLQEKQEGFDASIVKNAIDAEKALEEAVTDTGTTRAKVERLDKKTAQRGAMNVVTAAVTADKADGQGVEPPQMDVQDPTVQEPETPQEPSEPVDPTPKTQDGGDASEGGEEQGSQAPEPPSETPSEPKSKKKVSKKKAAKKKSSK